MKIMPNIVYAVVNKDTGEISTILDAGLDIYEYREEAEWNCSVSEIVVKFKLIRIK